METATNKTSERSQTRLNSMIRPIKRLCWEAFKGKEQMPGVDWGETINRNSYSGDTVLIAENEHDLQKSLSERLGSEWLILINLKKKTKSMMVSGNGT